MNQRLILVDIENLSGGSALVRDTIEETKADLSYYLEIDEHDMMIVASGTTAFAGWAFAWGNVGRRIGYGIDGADHELLMELANVKPGRFSEVILASGDGIFTEEVSRLGSMNIPVTVIALNGCCSRRLQLAASKTILYTPTYSQKEAA